MGLQCGILIVIAGYSVHVMFSRWWRYGLVQFHHAYNVYFLMFIKELGTQNFFSIATTTMLPHARAPITCTKNMKNCYPSVSKRILQQRIWRQVNKHQFVGFKTLSSMPPSAMWLILDNSVYKCVMASCWWGLGLVQLTHAYSVWLVYYL